MTSEDEKRTIAPIVDPDQEILRTHGPALRMSHAMTRGFGSPWAFTLIGLGAAVWLGAGIATDFSRAWELVATVGMPLLALMALVVVQHTQNHNDRALQLKLDELLRVIDDADDRLVAVEDVDEQGLHVLRETYREVVGPDESARAARAATVGE